MRSDDKADREKNHGLARCVFPKGKSLDGLDRETVDFGSDNVNSFVREGKAFLVALGVRKIERRKARLAPPI